MGKIRPFNGIYEILLIRFFRSFSVSKHPELVQICRDRQIAIEVCPISNEVLVSHPGFAQATRCQQVLASDHFNADASFVWDD